MPLCGAEQSRRRRTADGGAPFPVGARVRRPPPGSCRLQPLGGGQQPVAAVVAAGEQHAQQPPAAHHSRHAAHEVADQRLQADDAAQLPQRPLEGVLLPLLAAMPPRQLAHIKPTSRSSRLTRIAVSLGISRPCRPSCSRRITKYACSRAQRPARHTDSSADGAATALPPYPGIGGGGQFACAGAVANGRPGALSWRTGRETAWLRKQMFTRPNTWAAGRFASPNRSGTRRSSRKYGPSGETAKRGATERRRRNAAAKRAGASFSGVVSPAWQRL